MRAKVGPFLDPTLGTPNPSPDFAADALHKQYNSVFAVPRPEWSVQNFKEHFKVDNGEESLNDINFSPEDIEKACLEIKSNSAPGPDGVPAILLKTCKKELSQPLYLLWRSSLDGGETSPCQPYRETWLASRRITWITCTTINPYPTT